MLLAEDIPLNQEVAVLMFEELGVQVDIAPHGRAAVEAYEKNKYDLIFMDCQMPEMDGLTATAEIRRREAESLTPHRIPIIAFTAHAITGDREQCFAAGMDDYLTKPFLQKDLRAVIARWAPKNQTIPAPLEKDLAEPLEASASAEGEIDMAALDRIRVLQRPGRPNVLVRILSHYVNDSPPLVNILETAVEARDATGIFQTAHRLKSTSANLGATRLASLCLELETRGRTNTLDGTPELYQAFVQEYHGVFRRFSEIIAEETS